MSDSTVRTRLTGPERRARIIDAAIELFAARGYDRVSVDDIAVAAGCSKALLYNHFTSKGELAVAAVGETNRALIEFTGRAVAEHLESSPRVRFEVGIDAFFAFTERNRTACRALFRDPSADPEVFEAHSKAKGDAARAVAAMLATGVHPHEGEDLSQPLELMGEMLTSALSGLLPWWEDHPDVPRSELVATVMSFCFLGLERLAQGERVQQGSDAGTRPSA